MNTRVRLILGCVCSCALLLLGCGNAEQGTGVAPSPSFAIFEQQIYPLLLRDCAFSGCHGKRERFFQVFGPGRTRLLASTEPSAPATPDEIMRSYERACSMLASGAQVEDSLLVRKPLEKSQGGQNHEGTDSHGRNVYRYRQDPGYVMLVSWAHSTLAGDATRGAAGSGAAP